MAVSGSHVKDGVAVVILDGVEGVRGELGDEEVDVWEVAVAGAEEEVVLVVFCGLVGHGGHEWGMLKETWPINVRMMAHVI